jgi:hypothetical protein
VVTGQNEVVLFSMGLGSVLRAENDRGWNSDPFLCLITCRLLPWLVLWLLSASVNHSILELQKVLGIPLNPVSSWELQHLGSCRVQATCVSVHFSPDSPFDLSLSAAKTCRVIHNYSCRDTQNMEGK